MVLGRVLNAAYDHYLRPCLLSAAIGLNTDGLDLSPFGLRPRLKRGIRLWLKAVCETRPKAVTLGRA